MMEILHVDDEPDIREVAAMSLAIDPAINVRSVRSGEEALEMLATGWRPDVVLLDVMMPDLDGPGTLQRLRKMPGHETTPVIFMTARAQASERMRFIDLGAIAVIIKPFDPMTLASQVRDHLASVA
ncbi:response regulator [Brevundimonas sp.]|uniref:response regulator n=1 Tax=Brevundimonas sp. TaxID=1871086 RepID=UPI003BABDD83